ncbi:hypothetical protein J2858_004688 [Neorhizobium galegae]|uniref:hypothetical protein n=1 Tax=Neorhizobium galegae TaxID=399 RepID=UPI001AE46BB5|nr:hypothetical protein [Neorhizobium galegae]MBP2551746.1 hypothetical protein [Neorhizobium galegae]
MINRKRRGTRSILLGLCVVQALAAPVSAAPLFSPLLQDPAFQASGGCLRVFCADEARVVHHHHTRVVVVRPVRPWVRRPYYGAVVAGVVLGTIIVASSVPPAPSPQLCWYWSSPQQNRGYWDYCKPH